MFHGLDSMKEDKTGDFPGKPDTHGWPTRESNLVHLGINMGKFQWFFRLDTESKLFEFCYA